MKHNILALVLGLALTSSCVNDLLDTAPFDSLTPDQTFASEQSIALYINQLYAMQLTMPPAEHVIGSPYQNYLRSLFHLAEGNDITYNALFVEEYYNPGAYTPDDEPFWNWGDLRKINYFLDGCKTSKVPANIRNHYIGIARWFRAKFYFEKVMRFGDVPWYSSVIGSNSEDLYKARDPRTLVMDSVLSDINFAVANISNVKDNSSTRITKWVALGLKTRICLTEGTFRKYHTELGLTATADAWLREAVDAGNQLMQSKQYTIYNTGNPDKDYRNLFVSDNVINTEVMLCIAHSDAETTWNHSSYRYSINGGSYSPSLTKRIVNTYLNIDGSRFTDIPGYDTIFFTREVKNRDLRLQQTIRTPSYLRTDGVVHGPIASVFPTLYHPMKWQNSNPYYDAIIRDVNDISLMRYAEVLLNYAEAKAELGTFTESDWNATVGELRKRAGIQNTSMPSTLDPYLKANFYENVTSPVIMEIRRERAIELILEENNETRWRDLMRWKLGLNVEKDCDGIYVPGMDKLYDLTGDGAPDICFVSATPANPVKGVYYMKVNNNVVELSEGTKGRLIFKPNMVKEFPDYKYYAPIPITEIVLNPSLKQNEGWE